MDDDSALVLAPLPQIDAALADVLSARRGGRAQSLHDAMEYAALGGGKRLRPALAWHACVALSSPGASSLPAGLALELVHAFSLVHDDLPALDNDDLRRGRPTLHKHAGEALAILAGDQLLAEAFDVILHEGTLSDGQRLALARELTLATGRMVSGQVHDTLGDAPRDLPPLERVRLVHNQKTGALIRASVVMGALCSARHRDAALLARLSRYGEAVGLMFQVVDDLLDVTQSAEHTGKRTGKDAQAGKLTYPGVLGVDGARAEVQRLLADAMDALAPLGTSANALAAAARYLAHRTK